MSTELIEKVDAILKKAEMPDRHTFFQLEKFVVGKEPTGQGQLWQVVRELQSRKETVDSYRKDLADAEDNLELFDIRIERLSREIRHIAAEEAGNFSDLEIQEREINIRKLQRDKEALIKSARKVNNKLKCILEEMAFLATGYEKILEHIGEAKPLDDEASQKEYWNERLLEEFNLRVILKRPLDPDFVKTVMALHDEAPVKKHVTAALEGIQQHMIEERRQAIENKKKEK